MDPLESKIPGVDSDAKPAEAPETEKAPVDKPEPETEKAPVDKPEPETEKAPVDKPEPETEKAPVDTPEPETEKAQPAAKTTTPDVDLLENTKEAAVKAYKNTSDAVNKSNAKIAGFVHGLGKSPDSKADAAAPAADATNVKPDV